MGQRSAEETDALGQIGEMWDNARGELMRLREMAEKVAEMSKAQASLSRIRTDREAALLKLGEAAYKLIEDGQLTAPAALKRVVGEVKAKDAELIRQQADILAIIKEADALAEKNKKTTAAKKKPAK